MSDLSPALRVPDRHSLLPHFLSGEAGVGVGVGVGGLNYIKIIFLFPNLEYMCVYFLCV